MALAMEPLCHTITTKAHFPKCPELLILSASFWEFTNSHFPYDFPFPQEELSFEKNFWQIPSNSFLYSGCIEELILLYGHELFERKNAHYELYMSKL